MYYERKEHEMATTNFVAKLFLMERMKNNMHLEWHSSCTIFVKIKISNIFFRRMVVMFFEDIEDKQAHSSENGEEDLNYSV